jgi:hypothetical protein
MPWLTHYGRGGLGLASRDFDPILPAPTAVFAFRDAPSATEDAVGFELVTDVEQTGGSIAGDDSTFLEVRAVTSDGQASDPLQVSVDTGRPGYFELPAEVAATGDFDVQFRVIDDDRIVSMGRTSLRRVDVGGSFTVSFLKALASWWLLGVLVAAIGLTLGTFVSWPIALVATAFALGGRWAITQVAVAYDGRAAVAQMFGDGGDGAAREVVREGIDALNATSQQVAAFLPPTGSFDQSEKLGRGHRVPWGELGENVGFTLIYSVPLLALAYVLLRNKEVAP